VVYHSTFADELSKVAPKLPQLQHRIQVSQALDMQPLAAGALDYETLLAQGSETMVDPDRSDNDLYLLCTGGTTGLPKGVMWPTAPCSWERWAVVAFISAAPRLLSQRSWPPSCRQARPCDFSPSRP